MSECTRLVAISVAAMLALPGAAHAADSGWTSGNDRVLAACDGAAGSGSVSRLCRCHRRRHGKWRLGRRLAGVRVIPAREGQMPTDWATKHTGPVERHDGSKIPPRRRRREASI